MADSGSTLLIEELSAAAGRGRRTLLLQGASLPLQGAEWSGENNVKTVFLPGNRRATRQVSGPKILPSTWTGEWHLDQLVQPESSANWSEDGDPYGILITEPIRLFEIFESIRQAARLVRVTWSVTARQTPNALAVARATGGSTGGRIVCEGGLDKFGAKFDRSEDATWDVTFNWVSRGAKQAPARSSASSSLVASSGRLSAASSKLANAATGSPLQAFDPSVAGSASNQSLGRLEGLSVALESLVGNATQAIVQLASGVASATALGQQLPSMPTAVQQSAVAQARDAASQALLAIDQMGRVPFELMTSKPYLGDAAIAWLRYQEVQQALDELAGESITMRDQLQAAQAAPALGADRGANASRAGARIHTCAAGDTPESVSLDEYETDEYARLICEANGLPWHWPGFYAGQKIIIPIVRANPQP